MTTAKALGPHRRIAQMTVEDEDLDDTQVLDCAPQAEPLRTQDAWSFTCCGETVAVHEGGAAVCHCGTHHFRPIDSRDLLEANDFLATPEGRKFIEDVAAAQAVEDKRRMRPIEDAAALDPADPDYWAKLEGLVEEVKANIAADAEPLPSRTKKSDAPA